MKKTAWEALGISEDEYWDCIVKEGERQMLRGTTEPDPDEIEDRKEGRRRLMERLNVFLAEKNTSCKGLSCLDLNCDGVYDDEGKCPKCGIVVGSIKEYLEKYETYLIPIILPSCDSE